MINPNEITSIKEVNENEIPDTLSEDPGTSGGASTEETIGGDEGDGVDEGQEQSTETQETKDTSKESSADSSEAAASAQSSEQQQAQDEDYYEAEEIAGLTRQFTNGEFTNPAELYSKYKELQSKQDPLATVSPFIKKLAEYEKAGGDPRFFVEVQSQDFSKMEPKEILRQKFLKEKAGKFDSKEDANILFETQFKRKYGQLVAEDEESLSPEEKRALEVELKMEAKEAREELENWQKESAVFKPKDEDPQLKAQQEAYIQNHLNAVKKSVENFTGLNIPVNENAADDFKYAATPEIKQKVEKWMSDPHGEFLSAIAENEQGDIDYEKLRLATAILADPEGFVSNLYKYAYGKGQEGLVAQRKNQADPATTTTGSQTSLKSEDQQLLEGWLNS